jgi:hypothetical protein
MRPLLLWRLKKENIKIGNRRGHGKFLVKMRNQEQLNTTHPELQFNTAWNLPLEDGVLSDFVRLTPIRLKLRYTVAHEILTSWWLPKTNRQS